MSGIKINMTQVEAVYNNLCTNARLESSASMLLGMLAKRIETLRKQGCIDTTKLSSELEELHTQRKKCVSPQSILTRLGISKNQQGSVRALAGTALVYLDSIRPIQSAIRTSNTGLEQLTAQARGLLEKLDSLGNIPADIAALTRRSQDLVSAIGGFRTQASDKLAPWKHVRESSTCLRELERRLDAISAPLASVVPGRMLDTDVIRQRLDTAAETIRKAEIAFSAACSGFDDTQHSLAILESIAAKARLKTEKKIQPAPVPRPEPELSKTLDKIACLTGEAEQIVQDSGDPPDTYLSGLLDQIHKVFQQRRDNPGYACTTIDSYRNLMYDYSIKLAHQRAQTLDKMRAISARLREQLEGRIRPSDQLEPQLQALSEQVDALVSGTGLTPETVEPLEQEADRLCAQAQAEEEQLYLQLTLISRIHDSMFNLGYELDGEPEIHDDRPGMISRMRYRLSENTWVVVHVSPSLKTSWYVEYAAPAGTKCTDDLSNEDHEELVETMRQWEADYLSLGKSLADEGIRFTIEKMESQRIDEYTFVEREAGQQQPRRAVQTVRNHLQH